MTAPDGRTPAAPDVDQPEGGDHDTAAGDTGRTPAAADQAEGDDDG